MGIKSGKLTKTEENVLRSLRRRGPIRGVKALAEATTGRQVPPNHVNVLQLYLNTTMHLAANGTITITRLADTVELQLTSRGRTLARSLEPTFLRRHPAVIAAASLGITAAMAGCSLLVAKPTTPQYVPEPPPPAKVTQVHKPTSAGAVWTYCERDCPSPTPKTLQAEEPRPVAKLPPLPAPQQKLALSADVLFDFDSASVSNSGLKVLDDLGAKLKTQGRLKIDIAGFTDRLGPNDYNLKLSQKRAEAVKGRLSSVVDASTINAVGRGKENPVTDGKCARVQPGKLVACLQPDRRVEINVAQLSR